MVISDSFLGECLVFVVGCPRSGTTWVQRLLASHPNVATGQETDLFDVYVGPQIRAWRRFAMPGSSGRGIVGLACYMDDARFLKGIRTYLVSLLNAILAPVRDGQMFVEKTPSHALFLEEIRCLLPACKVIHVVRDPRDVAASLLAASQSWAESWAPKDADSASRLWLEHVSGARKGLELFGAEKYVEIRYEDLFAEPEQYLGILWKFLSLSFDNSEVEKAVLANKAEATRSGKATKIPLGGIARTHFGGHVRDPEGFVRSNGPGAWRQELSWRSARRVERIAGQMMASFGYE